MSNKIQLRLEDILPDREALIKFNFLLKNREELIDSNVEDESEKDKFDDFYAICNEIGLNGEMTAEMLILARVFYLAQLEVELSESEVVNDDWKR